MELKIKLMCEVSNDREWRRVDCDEERNRSLKRGKSKELYFPPKSINLQMQGSGPLPSCRPTRCLSSQPMGDHHALADVGTPAQAPPISLAVNSKLTSQRRRSLAVEDFGSLWVLDPGSEVLAPRQLCPTLNLAESRV